MHKDERNRLISRIAIAMVVGVVAIPAMTTGLLRSIHSIDDDGYNVIVPRDQVQRALQDKVSRRLRERRYWGAMDVYRDLRESGITGLPLPDVNDQETVDLYYDQAFIDLVKEEGEYHGSAPEGEVAEEVEELTIRDRYDLLLERYRDLIDGYIFIGSCPNRLKTYHKEIVPDLYEICTGMLELSKAERTIDRRVSPIRGFVPGRTAEGQSIRSRLKQMDLRIQYLHGASKPPSRRTVRPTGE